LSETLLALPISSLFCLRQYLFLFPPLNSSLPSSCCSFCHQRFGIDFDGPSPSAPPLSVLKRNAHPNKSTQAHHNSEKKPEAASTSAEAKAAIEVERLCNNFGRLASVANAKGRGAGASTSVVLNKLEFGSVLKEMHVLVARQTLFQGAARAACFFRRAIIEEQLLALQHLHTLNPSNGDGGGQSGRAGSKVLLAYLAKQLKLAKQLEHATRAEKAAKAAETSAHQTESSSSSPGIGAQAATASTNAATAAIEAETAAREGLNLVLEEAWIAEWVKGLVASSGSTAALGNGSNIKSSNSTVGLTALGLSKEMKRIGKSHSLKDYDGSDAVVQKVQTFLGFATKSSGPSEVAASASSLGGEPPSSLAAHALASGLSRAVNHAATLRQASDLDAVLLLVDNAVEHYTSASDPASSRHALAAARLFDEWFGAPATRRRRAEQLQEEASAAAAQADLAAAQAANAASSSASTQGDSGNDATADGNVNPKKSLLKAFGGGVSSGGGGQGGGAGGSGLLAKMRAAGKLTILANRMRTDAMAAQARAAAAASRAHFDSKSNQAGGGAQAVNVAQVSDLSRALWTIPLPLAISSGKAAARAASSSSGTGAAAAAAPLVTWESWQWARARGVVLDLHRISQAAAKLRSSRGQPQQQHPVSMQKKHVNNGGPSSLSKSSSSLPLQISALATSAAAGVVNRFTVAMAPVKDTLVDEASSAHADTPATVLTPAAVLLYAPTHPESRSTGSGGVRLSPTSSSLVPPPPKTADAAAPQAKTPSLDELALRVFVWRLACLATSTSKEARALAAHLATNTTTCGNEQQMETSAGISDHVSQKRAGTFLKQVGRMSASEFEKALRQLRRAVSPTAQAERQQAAQLCLAVYGAVCARAGVELMGATEHEDNNDEGRSGGDEHLRGSALACARQWCAQVIAHAGGGENAQPYATPYISPLDNTAVLDRASLHKSLRDLFPRGSLAPHVDDLVRAVHILLGKDKTVAPGTRGSPSSKSCTTRDLVGALEVARDWSGVLERQEEEVEWCRQVLMDVDHLAASQRWRARDLFQALHASHVASSASSSSSYGGHHHHHGSASGQRQSHHHHHLDDASLSPLALETALRRWGVCSSLGADNHSNNRGHGNGSDQDGWDGDHGDEIDAGNHALGNGSSHSERFPAQQGPARSGARGVGGHAGGDFAAWVPLDSNLDAKGAAAAGATTSVTAESCEGEAWLRQFVLDPYQQKLSTRKVSLQQQPQVSPNKTASGPFSAIPLGLTALAIRASGIGGSRSNGRASSSLSPPSNGRASSSLSPPNATTPVSLDAFATAVRTLRRVFGPETTTTSSSLGRSQRRGSVAKAWLRGAQAIGVLDAADGGSGGVGAVSNATAGTALRNSLDLFAAAIAASFSCEGQDAAVSAAVRQGSSLAHVVVLGLGQLRYRQAIAQVQGTKKNKTGSSEDFNGSSSSSGGSGTSSVFAFVVPTAVETAIAQILAAASDADAAAAPEDRESLRQDGAVTSSDDGYDDDNHYHHRKSSSGATWQQKARDLVMFAALCFRGGASDVHTLLDLARCGADRVALLEEELNAFEATLRHYHWRLADLFHRAALLSGPETAGVGSSAGAGAGAGMHPNSTQEGSGLSPQGYDPVPMPPSAFDLPPSAGAAGADSSQRVSSNRGLTSSFASATQPQAPGHGSDRVPDDRAIHLNKFAAETVVAKGQLDALLSSLGFFHHAAPHPMPPSVALPPQPHSEAQLPQVPPPSQGPSRLPSAHRGATKQAAGSKEVPSRTTGGSSSSNSREEDALLADLEWKVEHLSKVVTSMEEHKNMSASTHSRRRNDVSNSRSVSDNGRHSPASSGQSLEDEEDQTQELEYNEPLYSAMATATATMALTDGGGSSSSGMLDVTGLSEEGGEEDTALMEQLAAALSQRIKTIYDV